MGNEKNIKNVALILVETHMKKNSSLFEHIFYAHIYREMGDEMGNEQRC